MTISLSLNLCPACKCIMILATCNSNQSFPLPSPRSQTNEGRQRPVHVTALRQDAVSQAGIAIMTTDHELVYPLSLDLDNLPAELLFTC